MKKADEANGITWFAMAGANNAYAIAANPDAAQEFGVATISDWARLAQENPKAATLCTAAEFPTRNDGLPAVEKTYGFDLPDADVAVLDFGLVYTSVAARNPCNFAVVFGTDAQVLANKLVVLQDDKQALATYNVAVSMRTETYQAHAAAYEAIFGAIAKELTTQRATELNSKVDIDGETPEEVAKEFLTQTRSSTADGIVREAGCPARSSRGAGRRPGPAVRRKAAVFAAELGRAVVADEMSDAGDVVGPRQQQRPGLLQPDPLLELERAHRGHGAEVAMEGEGLMPRAEARSSMRMGSRVVLADPLDRPADQRQAAVGEPDLAEQRRRAGRTAAARGSRVRSAGRAPRRRRDGRAAGACGRPRRAARRWPRRRRSPAARASRRADDRPGASSRRARSPPAAGRGPCPGTVPPEWRRRSAR